MIRYKVISALMISLLFAPLTFADEVKPGSEDYIKDIECKIKSDQGLIKIVANLEIDKKTQRLSEQGLDKDLFARPWHIAQWTAAEIAEATNSEKADHGVVIEYAILPLAIAKSLPRETRDQSYLRHAIRKTSMNIRGGKPFVFEGEEYSMRAEVKTQFANGPGIISTSTGACREFLPELRGR